MQTEQTFVGIISCFDGRVISQARVWARERFASQGAEIDMVTSLAPERALTGTVSAEQESLRAQIIHAAEAHGVTDWALVAHAGCEAGEATRAEALARLAEAATALRAWGIPLRRVVSVYLDENGAVEQVPVVEVAGPDGR